MTSTTSQLETKLANLLRAISDEEARIEAARQELADNDKFEPSTAFNGIAAKGADHLTIPQVLELIKNSSINAIRRDVEDVLRFYGIKASTQISYYDFLNIMVPKNNPMLRKLCIERLPYYKAENFELSFDIRYGIVKVFEKTIEALRKLEAYKVDLYQVTGNNPTEAFNLLCQGKSNTIEYFSLYTFFKKIQVTVNDKEINTIIKHLDKDKDGEITYSEFLDGVTPHKSPSEIERPSTISAKSHVPDLLLDRKSIRPSHTVEPVKHKVEERGSIKNTKPIDTANLGEHSFRPSYRVDPIPSIRSNQASSSNNTSNHPSHRSGLQIGKLNTIESNFIESALAKLNDVLPSTPRKSSSRHAYTTSKYFHASYEKLKRYERLTSPPVKAPRRSSSKSPRSRRTPRSPRLRDSEVPRESPLRKSRSPSPSTRKIEFDPVETNPLRETSAARLSPDRNESGIRTPLQRLSQDRPNMIRSSPQRRSPSRLSGRHESPLREAYLEGKGPTVKILDQSETKADISHNLSGYKFSDRPSFKSNEKLDRHSLRDYKTPERLSESPLRQSREKFLSTGITTSTFSPSKYTKDVKDMELFFVLKRQIELIREAEHEKNRLALRADFDIYEAFRLFDHDPEGHINRGDLKEGLDRLNVILSKKEAYVLTKLLDKDADDAIKFIHFREFFTPSERRTSPSRLSYKTGSRESQAMRPDTIELMCRVLKNLVAIEIAFQELCKRIPSGGEAFEQLDKKQHGYVTLHDLEGLFKEQNISVSSKEVLSLLEKYDRDQDAKVSYSDFIQTIATRAPEY